ncbi:(2Fe-2S) ferredoxin domain-containing protein [Leptolyngbya ohadii]|uniref:(2Fe-2S) ferredoxin domain-containing protein n=1 Tax=Leptolyngbya ohadii TaxID=1962290 RepID=UPI000B5A18C6|nr:(2Fe-2S) ferredoxin domain-containing protein [Leptolyngbya ohadii]
MTHCSTLRSVDFRLEGQFLGFALGDGYKLKYLRLATEDGEQQIKLSKPLRPLLYRSLLPGMRVEVLGNQKWNLEKGIVKRKAYQVTPLITDESAYRTSRESSAEATIGNTMNRGGAITIDKPDETLVQPPISPEAAKAKKQKTCIFVCGKSDCCKKGGKAIIASLQEELSDRGLDQEITVKATGCMKRCKAGPNVVMPDKTRYSKISAKEIPSILTKHFPEA